MPGFSVFYSWQSDLRPRSVSRDLIRECAAEAIKRIGEATAIHDAPRIDEALEGVGGIPAIGETILRKIRECGVFLGDVSLVGKAIESDKLAPNPNVLMELGYAAAQVGWNRMILVMNTRHGTADLLPFDLKYRRFPYQFSVKDDKSNIGSVRKSLTSYIELALNTMVYEQHQTVNDISQLLDGMCRRFLHEHAGKSHFWETDPKLHGLPDHKAHVLRRLVDLGVLEVVPLDNAAGYAYTWTYIGKLCLKHLGFRTADIPATEDSDVVSNVVVELADYEELLRGIEDSQEDGRHD